MGCREGLLAMRTDNDAIVREIRVVFEHALAEKRRRVSLSAQESAMCRLVCDQLFFRLEHQLTLLARKFRLASLNVRVVLHFRRQREAAIFARRRDRPVTWNGVERQFHFGEEGVTQKKAHDKRESENF